MMDDAACCVDEEDGQSGDATSNLHLMHLKAVVQMVGLDNGTLDQAMIEKVVLDGVNGQ